MKKMHTKVLNVFGAKTACALLKKKVNVSRKQLSVKLRLPKTLPALVLKTA